MFNIKPNSFFASDSRVEVAQLADGRISLRNLRSPGRRSVVFTQAEWDAFLRGAKRGEFDHFAGRRTRRHRVVDVVIVVTSVITMLCSIALVVIAL